MQVGGKPRAKAGGEQSPPSYLDRYEGEARAIAMQIFAGAVKDLGLWNIPPSQWGKEKAGDVFTKAVGAWIEGHSVMRGMEEKGKIGPTPDELEGLKGNVFGG